MRKKWILLPLVLILMIIMSIGMFYHNKLVDVSKLIEKENTEDLILTIYYMYPDVLTDIPISIDMIKSYEDEDKIVVTGDKLAEHIEAFKQINKKTLKLAGKASPYENVRMYYIFESKKNGKLFNVALGGTYSKKVIFNGVEIKSNRIFYDAVLPFLPEDIAEAWAKVAEK